jgi:uncharacterized protein YaiI (UPF0178 family)
VIALRHAVPVKVVANQPRRVPDDPLIELVVVEGFGAADDWIAGQAKPGDVCVTADVPLAARVVAAGGVCVDPRGRLLDAGTVGEALAVRDLMQSLREAGTVTGGPKAMSGKARSGFKDALHRVLEAGQRRR